MTTRISSCQRVNNIVEELKGEKVDIVKWSEDPAVYSSGLRGFLWSFFRLFLRGGGVLLCPQAECLKRARKARALERAFSAPMPDGVYEALEDQMREGSDPGCASSSSRRTSSSSGSGADAGLISIFQPVSLGKKLQRKPRRPERLP